MKTFSSYLLLLAISITLISGCKKETEEKKEVEKPIDIAQYIITYKVRLENKGPFFTQAVLFFDNGDGRSLFTHAIIPITWKQNGNTIEFEEKGTGQKKGIVKIEKDKIIEMSISGYTFNDVQLVKIRPTSAFESQYSGNLKYYVLTSGEEGVYPQIDGIRFEKDRFTFLKGSAAAGPGALFYPLNNNVGFLSMGSEFYSFIHMGDAMYMSIFASNLDAMIHGMIK